MSKKAVNLLCILAIAGLFIFGDQDGGGVLPDDKRDTPSRELQELVEPIRKNFRNEEVGRAYRDFAWAIGRSNLTSTGQLQSALERFESSLWTGRKPPDDLQGLDVAIQKAKDGYLGNTDGVMEKKKAVEVFEAIAWALGG